MKEYCDLTQEERRPFEKAALASGLSGSKIYYDMMILSDAFQTIRNFESIAKHVKTLKLRARFVETYCKERGWNQNELSLNQILEIR